MRRPDGKVAIVTGASRGIAAEIARGFAAEGGRVVCAARSLSARPEPALSSAEGPVEGRADSSAAHGEPVEP
jgi:NAD(P)-dependent dehydrogenase (short-subunit alcohol dehydrogenase family)